MSYESDIDNKDDGKITFLTYLIKTFYRCINFINLFKFLSFILLSVQKNYVLYFDKGFSNTSNRKLFLNKFIDVSTEYNNFYIVNNFCNVSFIYFNNGS